MSGPFGDKSLSTTRFLENGQTIWIYQVQTTFAISKIGAEDLEK
jgi:hypothetical protein